MNRSTLNRFKLNRFKNHLIVAAVFALPFVVGKVLNTRPALADGPPSRIPVNIVNPLPVPVTGSTTVSGTVEAKITGIPNVNISNIPLSALNVGDPGRIPYQQSVSAGGNEVTFGPVPANHRLVVQRISGLIFYTSPPHFAETTVASTLDPNDFLSRFTTNITALGGSIFNEPVQLYVDQNQTFIIGAATDTTVRQVEFIVTGYLLDCSAAPCAAIASLPTR